jgi:hypothetical protein
MGRVLLVLRDENFDATAIYEADRPAVVATLTAPGSKARNERGAPAASKFRAIGRSAGGDRSKSYRSEPTQRDPLTIDRCERAPLSLGVTLAVTLSRCCGPASEHELGEKAGGC